MSEGKERKIIPVADRLPADPAVLHPVVAAMLKVMDQNPTPETLEKLLNVQREHDKDRAKRAFTEAIVELKRDLPPIILKDKKVGYDGKGDKGPVKYTHASMANVMREITPALTEHGFSIGAPGTTFRDPDTKRAMVRVTATLTHHAGHSESTVLESEPDMSGSKNAAQGIGSTITYLGRYGILSILGIATEDMKEPEPKSASQTPPKDNVDPQRNLRALSFAMNAKKMTKDQVEKHVGKPVEKWNQTDLDKLRYWTSPQPKANGAPAAAAATNPAKLETKAPPRETKPPAVKTSAPVREPGQDEGEDLGSNLDFTCTEPGCKYHTEKESLFVDHQDDTGHMKKRPQQPPSEGGLFGGQEPRRAAPRR